MTWSVRFLEEKKAEHIAHVDEFRGGMEKAIQVLEEKLRALSLEYDEELYPHLMSTIAERRYKYIFPSVIFVIVILFDIL